MNVDKFLYCVSQKKLPLTTKERIFHYQISLFSLAVGLFSFHLMFSSNDIELRYKALYLFLTCITLSIILYFIQKQKLKFLVRTTILNEKKLAEVIDFVASHQEWKETSRSNTIYTAKCDDLFSGMYGEQITILFYKNKIYYNCICDLNKWFAFTSWGRRWFHKRTFLAALKLLEEDVIKRAENKTAS